jgi:hypothetical protein
MDDVSPALLFLACAGFVGGISLFVRGLIAYRRDRLISSVATSSLDGIAAGEVRVSGVVEPLEQTLVSPLQSRPCVWYRARIETTDDEHRTLLDDERAVSFRLDDGRGQIRVVPRRARWEIDDSLDETAGAGEVAPPGLDRRQGPAYAAVKEVDPERMTEAQRQAAIEALLTVDRDALQTTLTADPSIGDVLGAGLLRAGPGRRYREARLEPGATVTIIGQALPWGDLVAADQVAEASVGSDPAIEADLAAARAAGTLTTSAEDAWGNAAIPGFGIGRPTERPTLDPDAHTPPIEDPRAFDETLKPYRITDDTLVLAGGPGSGLAIYLGGAAAATRHHDLAFLLGLSGAVMAVVSALGLGAVLAGSR